MAKSKFTKAKEITDKTKRAVLERQGNRSISGATLTLGNTEFHHVRPRSSSGVGYEWNIVAITSEEHRQLTDKVNVKFYGRDRYTWQEFDTLIKNHLKIYYPNWTYTKCKYQKGYEVEDYGIVGKFGKNYKSIK